MLVVSYDTDGRIVSRKWKRISDEWANMLCHPDKRVGVDTCLAPIIYIGKIFQNDTRESADLEFELTVTDDDGLEDTSRIRVTVLKR
jgi:hypothetical protein